MKKMHKGQKGLTLIELLIVVAILGIIAAVVIPNLGAFMVTGRISAANTELENVKTASLAYFAENEAWPVDSTHLEGVGVDGFISGDLKATYEFDTEMGWVIDITPGSSTYSGISFNATTDAHGNWIRGGSGTT